MKNKFHPTSWQKVAPWYSKITRSGKGHYYHEHVVIPGVLRLLGLSLDSTLLDVACGNGVLARSIPKNVNYLGIDAAPSLVSEARRMDKNSKHKYVIGDVTNSLNINGNFTHAAIILALQNIKDSYKVLTNISKYIMENGKLVIVLNHPAFRIPRQSSWGIDENKKAQYRRIDRYMTPMEIPINPHTYKSDNVESEKGSVITISYHHPLSYYSKILKDAGFMIELMEEWTSDRQSEGKAKRMENRSRNEIPLFLVIVARKLN